MLQARRRMGRSDIIWAVFPSTGRWQAEDLGVTTLEEKMVQELASLSSIPYIPANEGNATAFFTEEDGKNILEMYHELYS